MMAVDSLIQVISGVKLVTATVCDIPGSIKLAIGTRRVDRGKNRANLVLQLDAIVLPARTGSLIQGRDF